MDDTCRIVYPVKKVIVCLAPVFVTTPVKCENFAKKKWKKVGILWKIHIQQLKITGSLFVPRLDYDVMGKDEGQQRYLSSLLKFEQNWMKSKWDILHLGALIT